MMKTTTYKDRVRAHDMLALPAVDYLFNLMGYNHFEIGIEREKKKFRDALKNRNDPQALKIRFSPDRFYSQERQNIIVCEIKSEYKHHKNYAIEFDSYLQAIKYSENGYLYAFVQIKKWYGFFVCDVLFSTVDNIPPAQEFIVPKSHPDRNSFITRIKDEFPETNISHRENVLGSGTPFFLLPKQSDFMIKPSVFFDSTKDELSWPILFDRMYKKIDVFQRLYTHNYHGGRFFRIGRFPGWKPYKGTEHLNPPPWITHMLTLASHRMGHRNIWTFTDISLNELMTRITNNDQAPNPPPPRRPHPPRRQQPHH